MRCLIFLFGLCSLLQAQSVPVSQADSVWVVGQVAVIESLLNDSLHAVNGEYWPYGGDSSSVRQQRERLQEVIKGILPVSGMVGAIYKIQQHPRHP